MAHFVSGLDLGQMADYSALVVCEQQEGPDPLAGGRVAWHYAVRAITRYPLGTPYTTVEEGAPGIGEQVADFFARPELRGSALAVDQTGVGKAVVDLLRGLRPPCLLRAVTITAGERWSSDGLDFHAPKRELVGTLQSVLQSGRLRVAKALPLAKALEAELHAFRVKQKPSGHESFEALGQTHDDLVLALSLAVWVGERCPPLRAADIGRGRGRQRERGIAGMPAGVFGSGPLPGRW